MLLANIKKEVLNFMHNKHYLHMQTFVTQIFRCYGLKKSETTRAYLCALKLAAQKDDRERLTSKAARSTKMGFVSEGVACHLPRA
jgi:hypothetical protein